MSVPVFKALKNEKNSIMDHLFFFLFVAGYKAFATVKSLKRAHAGNLRTFDVALVKSFLKIIFLDETAKTEIELRHYPDEGVYRLTRGDLAWFWLLSETIVEKNLTCEVIEPLKKISTVSIM